MELHSHPLPPPLLNPSSPRKFKYLLKHLPDKVDTIVSHGGVQSNAMVALAALGMATKTSVVYYCKKPGRWLTSNPSGNYHRALSLGIELHYLKNDEYSKRFPTTPMLQRMPTPPEEAGRSLWVPQGGAMKEAQEVRMETQATARTATTPATRQATRRRWRRATNEKIPTARCSSIGSLVAGLLRLG